MANLSVEFKGNGIIKTFSRTYPFKCFTITRDCISAAISEIKTKNGVYFLIDSFEGRKDNEGNAVKRKLYVGKTTIGMQRFYDHRDKKDWWDKILYFTADDENFTESTISGLENYLITKYTESGLYTMQNKANSNKRIDEDCEIIGDEIIGMMDYFGYPAEDDSSVISGADESINATDDDNIENAIAASELFNKYHRAITALAPDQIKSDKLKLYTAYKYGNKNLCAVWVKSYGLEIELYIDLNDIRTPGTDAFDITSRKRGNRKSAIRVKNEAQLEKAIAVIKEIIGNN